MGLLHGRAGRFTAPFGGSRRAQCKPWCLFNLTADIGERDDLGQSPAYQAIAETIAARLKHHGATGPPPAYIWPDLEEFQSNIEKICAASLKSGILEPLDDGV